MNKKFTVLLGLVNLLVYNVVNNTLFCVHLGLLSYWMRFFFPFQGIWIGMLLGTVVQTIVLFVMIYRTNWNKEVNLIFPVRLQISVKEKC